MKEFVFLVESQYNNYTVQDFLIEKGLSKELIKKVKYGGVFINESKVLNVNNRVKVGNLLKMVLPSDEQNMFIIPRKSPLKVIYEDEYFIAVNKESGVITHSSRYNKTLSLEEIVCGYFAPTPFCFRPINRLDKDTSGIVLIAKDEFSASKFNEIAKNGGIKKEYYAVVENKPEQNSFIVENYIKKESPNSMRRVINKDGQYAKTEFEYIKPFLNGTHLLKAILHTGRTHQIRVHLKSVGLPLYADGLYGNLVNGKTYVLHAYKMEFTHPFTNKKITLISPLEL